VALSIVVRELTECYKCETKIMSEVEIVHPLCANCDDSFESWFNAEVEKILH
jgi:hypothetical protein